MAQRTASVATEHASRYLQQLCKHWSHRFTVEFDSSHGVVHLADATCSFDAQPGCLVLRLEGEGPETPERLCGVVSEHLQRFAFREALVIDWS